MSSAVDVAMPSTHHRRPLLWLIVISVAAVALAAVVLIVHDSGTDSTVESHAASPGPVATVVATPTVCSGPYGSLLTAMATSMSPEAVNRITPVLSEETRTGLRDTTEVLVITNSASPTPDANTLAWALGRLTAAERAAIVAELPPAIREAVANSALDAGLVSRPCP